MRLPLLIGFFFACAAYASPVGRDPNQDRRAGFKRSPPSSKRLKTSGEFSAASGCSMGPIQRIWNSERVSIGKTGSGTRGELFEIKGPAGKVGDREIIIKRITGHSSSHNHIEEAVRRESQNQRLVHQRAIDGYGVDLQPGGQVHYYIVLWKLGDRAEKTGLDPNALRQLKMEAWERVAKVGDIKYLTENSDFLFGKDIDGKKYEYAFPVELSNARLKYNGQFEDLHSDGPAEIFHDHEKCAA